MIFISISIFITIWYWKVETFLSDGFQNRRKGNLWHLLSMVGPLGPSLPFLFVVTSALSSALSPPFYLLKSSILYSNKIIIFYNQCILWWPSIFRDNNWKLQLGVGLLCLSSPHTCVGKIYHLRHQGTHLQ